MRAALGCPSIARLLRADSQCSLLTSLEAGWKELGLQDNYRPDNYRPDFFKVSEETFIMTLERLYSPSVKVTFTFSLSPMPPVL